MVQLNNKNKELVKAGKVIMNGGIVVYPTDTVYGIGCDPYSKKAIERLLIIKERENNPLPVLFKTVNKIEESVKLGKIGRILSKKFWPGPLTLVCPIKKNKHEIHANLGKEELGVRIPSNPITLELIDKCGGMIVGTSANISGKKSVRTIEELDNAIIKKVDIVIDGGKTSLDLESTVIRIVNNKIELIREGYIKFEAINETLEDNN